MLDEVQDSPCVAHCPAREWPSGTWVHAWGPWSRSKDTAQRIRGSNRVSPVWVRSTSPVHSAPSKSSPSTPWTRPFVVRQGSQCQSTRGPPHVAHRGLISLLLAALFCPCVTPAPSSPARPRQHRRRSGRAAVSSPPASSAPAPLRSALDAPRPPAAASPLPALRDHSRRAAFLAWTRWAPASRTAIVGAASQSMHSYSVSTGLAPSYALGARRFVVASRSVFLASASIWNRAHADAEITAHFAAHWNRSESTRTSLASTGSDTRGVLGPSQRSDGKTAGRGGTKPQGGRRGLAHGVPVERATTTGETRAGTTTRKQGRGGSVHRFGVFVFGGCHTGPDGTGTTRGRGGRERGSGVPKAEGGCAWTRGCSTSRRSASRPVAAEIPPVAAAIPSSNQGGASCSKNKAKPASFA